MDSGKELNKRIAAAKERINNLAWAKDQAENVLAALLIERDESRNECGKCNDCSMCLE